MNGNLVPKSLSTFVTYAADATITVLSNKTYSNTLPLENGIPQGSPLSVIIFAIAFNMLNKIIVIHKELSFNAYADDYTIVCKL